MISASSSGRYPWCRASATSSAPAATELDKPLVPERAQPAEDGVGIDAEDGSEVPGGRQPPAGRGLAVSYCAPDRRRDLLMKRHRA